MIKVFEGFSGVGGWTTSLKRLGIPFEVVGFSEIDKWAIKIYQQNHCDYFLDAKGNINNGITIPPNYGDITKINPEELPDFDLLCSSPSCQSFSVSGKNQGENDEKGRGRHFENAIDIMRVKKPRWAIYENVKGLTFKKHKEYFEYILQLMRDCGYYVKWKILNTKEYGIPQNRERIFIICFKEKEDYDNFEYPEKEELKIFVKDILEEEVDDRYVLSENQIKHLLGSMDIDRGFSKINPTIGISQTARQYSSWRGNFILQRPRGYNNGGLKGGNICPSISTSQFQDNNYLVQEFTKNKRIGKILSNPVNKSNLTYELTGDTPSGISRQGDRIFNLNSHAPTLNCTQKEYLFSNPNELEIRKLTVNEVFHLQGYKDEELDKSGISNSQLYKMAGNGLSINVVEKIFRELFKAKFTETFK